LLAPRKNFLADHFLKKSARGKKQPGRDFHQKLSPPWPPRKLLCGRATWGNSPRESDRRAVSHKIAGCHPK
jgi:hypothetical protein